MERHAFVHCDGRTLGYCTVGGDHAEVTLVCHPGGPGMSAAYLGELGRLGSRDLRVVLFDPRGTGRSDPPADGRYELEDYADDLDALRVQLGLEQIDLLGHSHGGFVAKVYALRHPGRLRRLVLAGTTPAFGAELSAEAEAAFAAHRDRPWYDDSRAAQRRRRAWDFTTREEAAALCAREARLWFAGDGPAVAAFLADFAGQRLDLDALRYFNERVAARYDMRSRLGEIAAATLIITGARDFFGPQVSARELAAIPESRVVTIPDAGHFAFVEAPGRFAGEVAGFLA